MVQLELGALIKCRRGGVAPASEPSPALPLLYPAIPRHSKPVQSGTNLGLSHPTEPSSHVPWESLSRLDRPSFGIVSATSSGIRSGSGDWVCHGRPLSMPRPPRSGARRACSSCLRCASPLATAGRMSAVRHSRARASARSIVPRPAPTCSTESNRRARRSPCRLSQPASRRVEAASSIRQETPLHACSIGPRPSAPDLHSWTNCAGPTGDPHNLIPQLHGTVSPKTSRGSKASHSGPTPARHIADRNDRWRRRSGCRAQPRAPLPVRSPRPPANRTRSTARGRPTRRRRLSIPRRTCGTRGSATGRPG